MNYVDYVDNGRSDEEEEEIKLITSSLLNDMITKVLLMRQQHLAELNK